MSLSTDFADGREGHQSFEYLSPGLQLHLHDLLLPPSPFADSPPEWVHVVCSVARVQAMIDEKKTLRLGQDGTWSGNLVWEPMPVSLPSLTRFELMISRAVFQLSCLLSSSWLLIYRSSRQTSSSSIRYSLSNPVHTQRRRKFPKPLKCFMI
jgi:hypothetical protein